MLDFGRARLLRGPHLGPDPDPDPNLTLSGGVSSLGSCIMLVVYLFCDV